MKLRILVLVALFLVALPAISHVDAGDETLFGRGSRYRARLRPWHGHYNNTQYGQPIALVVPPTAELTTDYGWGVPAGRMTRIDHQFQRPWPNSYGPTPPYGFMPTPRWPSDTRQNGTYLIRGPW